MREPSEEKATELTDFVTVKFVDFLSCRNIPDTHRAVIRVRHNARAIRGEGNRFGTTRVAVPNAPVQLTVLLSAAHEILAQHSTEGCLNACSQQEYSEDLHKILDPSPYPAR